MIQKYTVPTLIQESISKFADNTALVFAGEQNYTYRQMGEDVMRVAGLLKKAGIKKGDKVAILSSNMPNWGIAFFGISWAGATVVPILPDFHPNEIKSIVEHSEAKVMFVSEGMYASLNEETQNMLHQIILIDNFSVIPKGAPTAETDNLKSSLTGVEAMSSPAEADEEEVASIIYTSGTTGNSKGVMLTHKNLMWTAEKSYTFQDISKVTVSFQFYHFHMPLKIHWDSCFQSCMELRFII
jgi:long-chain acyl-CoA synthetase